jgi:hypothetical protein
MGLCSLTCMQLSDLLSYEDAVALEKVARESQNESKSMFFLTVSDLGGRFYSFSDSATGEEHKGCSSSQGLDDYQSCLSPIYNCCRKSFLSRNKNVALTLERTSSQLNLYIPTIQVTWQWLEMLGYSRPFQSP